MFDMKAYCVSYDLKAPNRDYTRLYGELKKSRHWWHYLESTWLIVTDESPAELWERYAPHIDQNDRLLIIEVRDNVKGWLTKKAWDWIHSNVPSP
jgi:hypothetical protein